ncbi:MAG: ankyrin repeat domain-containing protein [Wolbachia endosymbiont of Xenopsylla cheopis]
MSKLNKNVKNSLNLVWLIVTVMCVLITYYCMKAKATNNYKEILHTATENCSIEVIRLVVKNMIDIDNIETPDFTILHNAANVGCLEVIKFLLDEGANIHVIGRYGGTALHNATYKGHLEIVRFLLEKGANPNIKDGNGKTPRTVAVLRSRHNKDKPYDEIISLLYNAEKQYKSE